MTDLSVIADWATKLRRAGRAEAAMARVKDRKVAYFIFRVLIKQVSECRRTKKGMFKKNGMTPGQESEDRKGSRAGVWTIK
jgi:hypothetical protein